MAAQEFDSKHWERLCVERAHRCAARCLTPMHFVMILGQEIDDLLGHIPNTHVAAATSIARDFGYETAEERHALRVWVHAH